MESRLLEIEKHRRRQPLEELERKRKKAARIKGKRFTQEDLDYSWAWAEQMSVLLSEAGKRTACESLEASRERRPLPTARRPFTTTVTYRG